MTADEARTYGREMCWLAGVAERLSLRGVARANLVTQHGLPALQLFNINNRVIGVLDRDGVEEGRDATLPAQRIVAELREEYAREFGPKGERAQAAAPSRAKRFARECGPFRWRGEGFGCVVVAGDNDPICDCTFRNVAHDMVQDDYAEAIAAALNALGGHGETELPTLDDLARQQGVGPCDDADALVVAGIENEVAPHEETCENCRWGPVTAYSDGCRWCSLRPGRESAWEKKAEGGAE
jgi:hypothetical protein